MKTQVLGLILGMTVISTAQASWQSTINPDTVSGTTNVTLSPTLVPMSLTEEISDRTSKLLVAAQEDAQVFVASEGQIFGVNLATATEALRRELPKAAQATDMQIALLILGQ